MVVKTFRGILGDNTQDRIRLGTIKGKVGYRIKKLQVMPQNFNVTEEFSITVWKVEQSSMATSFDFTDANLLAAAYFEQASGSTESATTGTVIFDNEIFNQDIYIGNSPAVTGNTFINYYLELEIVPLTEQGAEYTTIKDLRSNA